MPISTGTYHLVTSAAMIVTVAMIMQTASHMLVRSFPPGRPSTDRIPFIPMPPLGAFLKPLWLGEKIDWLLAYFYLPAAIIAYTEFLVNRIDCSICKISS